MYNIHSFSIQDYYIKLLNIVNYQEVIMTEINYSMTPEFIVNHARGLLLSETCFSKAYKILSECSLSEYIIKDVLSGKMDIKNAENGMVNIFEVSESKYKTDLNFIYRNYFVNNGQVLKAYAVVTTFGYIDDFSRIPHLELTKHFLEGFEYEESSKKVLDSINYHIEDQSKQINNKAIRALHYADNQSYIVLTTEVNYETVYILCKPMDINIPDFLDIESRDLPTLYNSLLNSHYNLETIIRGYKSSYMWYEDKMFGSYYMSNKEYPKEFLHENGDKEIYTDAVGRINSVLTQKQVKQQVLNDSSVIKNGFLQLKDSNGKVLCTVPKLPFLHWALNATGYDMLPNYKPYSHVGMKMTGDNPYHSDWMIAAGLDLDNDYKSESAVYTSAITMMNKVQSDILDFECAVLSSGDRQAIWGEAFICTKDNANDVKEGDILILPEASFDFDEHIKRATKNGRCGMITAAGSKTCHVSVVSREMNFICLQDSDILSKVKTGVTIKILPEKGRFFMIVD